MASTRKSTRTKREHKIAKKRTLRGKKLRRKAQRLSAKVG